MAQGLKAMVSNVKNIKGYRVYFEAAFGTKEVSLDAIQKAIATFERTVTSKNSRFNLFVNGNKTILKDDEVMGLHLFRPPSLRETKLTGPGCTMVISLPSGMWLNIIMAVIHHRYSVV